MTRLLVVLHACAAIVLVGAATHQALVAWGHLRGRPKLRLSRIYGATVAGAYAVTLALGLAAYPVFRVAVRAAYLDRHAAWASNLFDLKENLAVLALPLVVIAAALARVLPPQGARAVAWTYAACVWLAAASVWFAVIAGLVISLERGV